MITTLEAIVRLREKTNRNNIHDNIDIDNNRALQLLNESQYKYVRWILDSKNQEDIRRIQFLLQPKKLKESKTTSNSSSFSLPDDWFDTSQLEVSAKSGDCTDTIFTWEVKTQNIPELLADENNKPSFYYRETFYNLEDNSIKLYTDNFTIGGVNLIYYRYPNKIDIVGHRHIDGSEGVTSNPEWDEYSINKIIDIATKDFNINTENFNRIQADNSRILNNF